MGWDGVGTHWQGGSLTPTSEHQGEREVGLDQHWLYVSPKELQRLSLASSWVEQDQQPAGPRENVQGVSS